jgi:hypothetical protein
VKNEGEERLCVAWRDCDGMVRFLTERSDDPTVRIIRTWSHDEGVSRTIGDMPACAKYCGTFSDALRRLNLTPRTGVMMPVSVAERVLGMTDQPENVRFRFSGEDEGSKTTTRIDTRSHILRVGRDGRWSGRRTADEHISG